MLFKQPIRQSKPMRPLRFFRPLAKKPLLARKHRPAQLRRRWPEAAKRFSSNFLTKVARLLACEVLQGVPSTITNIR